MSQKLVKCIMCTHRPASMPRCVQARTGTHWRRVVAKPPSGVAAPGCRVVAPHAPLRAMPLACAPRDARLRARLPSVRASSARAPNALAPSARAPNALAPSARAPNAPASHNTLSLGSSPIQLCTKIYLFIFVVSLYIYIYIYIYIYSFISSYWKIQKINK